MKIFLIGFMGSGKTTLGERLAGQFGWRFTDLDEAIASGEGSSIRAIFEEQGEAAFRCLEADYLRSLAGETKLVVATGGGTACFHENLGWMNQSGITIYLEMPVGGLFSRLENGQSERPLVAGMDPAELHIYIEKLLVERVGFYAEAHFSCNATAPIEVLEREISQYFKRFMR